MTGLRLARRTIARYRLRTALAVTGVAVIGALNFDMILLSRGLLLSFANLLDTAGFNVRVTGAGGLPTSRTPVEDADEVAAEIRRLPEVAAVAVLRLDDGSVSVPGHRGRGVTLIGAGGAPSAGWTLVAGRGLDDPDRSGPAPVVVSQSLADAFHLAPGSVVRLRPGAAGTSVAPSADCRVVGIATFTFESAGELTMATTLGAFDDITGDRRTDADIMLVRSREDAGAEQVAHEVTALHPELRAYSNADLVEQFNRNSFAYFRQISAVLSTTTALFTVLLVATLLTVSVNHRLGEIAALRAIGISRRRVVAMLLWESGLLVGAGGLLALPLGGAFAVVLDGILRRMPGLPERLHFFVFEPRAVVVHAALLAATGMAAALYPVRLAVTLPIAETLRREVVS